MARKLAVGVLTAALAVVVAAGDAAAATFSNPATITINDAPANGAVGAATPYPSTITVSSLAGTVSDVNVTIRTAYHAFADDVDILLVGPGGQTTLLMSDAGGTMSMNSATITFDDAAATSLPASGGIIGPGTYKPTNYAAEFCSLISGDTFPAPAPAGPYGATLSVFNGLSGSNLNGVWRLYVVDDCVGGSGAIQDGWTLEITTAPPTAVNLRDFTASSTQRGAILRWHTGCEANTLGFNVYRETRGELVQVNRSLLSRRGAGGASYSLLDRSASPAASYRLQLVTPDGSRRWVGIALPS